MSRKSKFATVVLSALPGLGHMYLGWQQRGLFFMLAFFLAISLTDMSGGLLLIGFTIPVIWFYSLFDALQCFDRDSLPPGQYSADWHWIFKKQRWIGISLIIVGTLLLLNKLALPLLLNFLTYNTIRLASVSFVALLLIAGGIRLAWGKPITSQDSPGGFHENGQPPAEARFAEPAEAAAPSGEDYLPGDSPQEEEE